MKDKRDKLIPEQLSGYTWELSGYAPKVPFSNSDSLSMREVRNAFQLTPEPPEMELNDYIREAVRKRDLSYFSFFLHHFENRLNGVIYRFLTRNGISEICQKLYSERAAVLPCVGGSRLLWKYCGVPACAAYRGDIYRFRQEPRRGRCEVCRKSRVQGGRRNG